MLKKNAG